MNLMWEMRGSILSKLIFGFLGEPSGSKSYISLVENKALVFQIQLCI